MKINYTYENNRTTFTLFPSRDAVQTEIAIFGSNWTRLSSKRIFIDAANPLTITFEESVSTFDPPRIAFSAPTLDIKDISGMDFLIVIETTKEGGERKKFVFIDSPRYWKIIAKTNKTTGFISRCKELNNIEKALDITIYIVDTYTGTWLKHSRYHNELYNPDYYAMCLQQINNTHL